MERIGGDVLLGPLGGGAAGELGVVDTPTGAVVGATPTCPASPALVVNPGGRTLDAPEAGTHTPHGREASVDDLLDGTSTVLTVADAR